MSDQDLKRLCERLDEAGVSVDQVGKVIHQFDRLSEAAGSHQKALELMQRGSRTEGLWTSFLTFEQALVLHEDLETLARRYIPTPWRMVEIDIGCTVSPLLQSERGSRWTIEVRCRSDGGASRHFWFKGHCLRDVADLAKSIMRGPWQGWHIHE